jgi:hypothetical protein
MLTENLSIEDLILHLGHFKDLDEGSLPPNIQPSDISLIYSFCQQINRGMGFTDRQYELAKRKVDDYTHYFSYIENLEDVKNNVSLPLREIDRSRWIKIIDNKIAVRFTFQKKLIGALEDLRSITKASSEYDKIKKIHYFDYSESVLYSIVKTFEEKHFELDETVQTIYDKLCSYKFEEHVPGVYNYELKNLHENGVQFIVDEIGQPSPENILLYKDRSIKYGLNVPDGEIITLADKIAHRTRPNVILNNCHTTSDMILALESLNRLPLLVIVPADVDKSYDRIVELQQHIRNLVSPEEISVVFRHDNIAEGVEFNRYIKRENINNKVDKNTKVVYTLDTKIPKPLLTTGWKPQSIMVSDGSFVTTRKVLDCFTDVDLILHTVYEGAGLTRYYKREFDRI